MTRAGTSDESNLVGCDHLGSRHCRPCLQVKSLHIVALRRELLPSYPLGSWMPVSPLTVQFLD